MQQKPKLTFIHSPEVYYEQNYGVQFAPVWAYTLAAYVDSQAWDMCIADLTHESVHTVSESTVFAFSGINQDFHAIQRTYQTLKAKYPNSTYILGGPITWSYEQSGKLDELKYFDYLFTLDGEELLPHFLQNFLAKKPLNQIQSSAQRFKLGAAKSLRFDLLKPRAKQYYGGVLEVSRGCPFLCEFCDIRVLPQNNESHTKDPALIVQELEQYYQCGIRQIQLACDNFIGDLQWANKCVDAILEWVESTGHQMALYTWLTINISSHSELLKKMRKAGFTAFFIGVETFNANSVLETSKVQNKNDKDQMVSALRTIHSYGFIVVPGLIFGFDSDSAYMYQIMLDGIEQSGLIGGDPTFLLALPGTPLYKRMKQTHRITEFKEESASLKLEKARISKIQSNIAYRQPQDFLIYGFMYFIKKFTSASFNYVRFKNHVDCIMNSQNLITPHAIGYGNVFTFLKFQLSSFQNIRRFILRNLILLKPWNTWTILRGYLLVVKHKKRYPGLKNHLFFWVFLWSNLLLKYRNLKASDFNVQSMTDVNAQEIWNFTEQQSIGHEEKLIGGKNEFGIKVQLQFKTTQTALQRLKTTSSEIDYNQKTFQNELTKFKKAS